MNKPSKIITATILVLMSFINTSWAQDFKLDPMYFHIFDKDSLKAAGLVRPNATRIKLLGDGEVTKALKVNVDLISTSAKAKIEASGGEFISE